MATLDRASFARWKQNPLEFIETCLIDPETGKPYVLLQAERDFLTYAFQRDANGRLKYSELIYSAPKKSGKTTLAAIFVLTLLILYCGNFAEAIIVANSFEQSVGRVHSVIRRIIEASPLLRTDATLGASKITVAGATILAIPSDAGSAAGSQQNAACYDELWAVDNEAGYRLFEELVPIPTKKIACRLTVTYAGFTGQSVLLEALYKRGLQQPQVAPSLYAGDGICMAWHHLPVAPWQDARWLEEMKRSLRPNAYARLVQNQFVSSESNFIDMSSWDACVIPDLGVLPYDRRTHVWVGVDASVKRDATALVACTYNKNIKCVRLAAHRVFIPTPGDPIDFEGTIEATLLEWNKKYRVRKVLFDPFQMASVAQRLAKARVPIEEYPQTVPNLTAATSNLFDLIQARQLVLYPDDAMRLAVSRAIIVESSRGWRLDKLKQQHKIDVIVALSMAALAAVRGQEEPFYDLDAMAGTQSDDPLDIAEQRVRQANDDYKASLLGRFGAPVALNQEERSA